MLTGNPSAWSQLVSGFRIVTTKLAAAMLFLIILVSSHRWPEGSITDLLLELLGMVLIVIATIGRLWCTLFIAGYKTRQLIAIGPFSVVRNPLYLFSLIGSIGVGLCTEMLTIVGLIALLFALYYPTVIRLEERRLREQHGAAYEEYCRRVPRLLPKMSLYQEPDSYQFNPRLLRRAFWDGIWFILLFPVLEVLERLHELRWLPIWVRLY